MKAEYFQYEKIAIEKYKNINQSIITYLIKQYWIDIICLIE